jgi:hypothetical protein
MEQLNMKTRLTVWLLIAVAVVDLPAASHKSGGGGGPLTPTHNTTKRGGYTIETVGDTLHQAKPENTRIIIRVSGSDKKLIKPDSIALIDKNGAAIRPVFREDRKVGHEENTGLPVSMDGGTIGVDMGKIFGPKGDYAYTKVDWPKESFAADKRLQIVMPGGQAIVLPLTSLAK